MRYEDTLRYRREQAYRELAASVTEVESGMNAYWLTRWLYRIVRVLSWRR